MLCWSAYTCPHTGRYVTSLHPIPLATRAYASLCCPVRLQAIFDLPSRMQAALEEDALDSAVSYYAEALPVLRKYGHKGAFRDVAVQADAAAKDIGAVLKRRLAERKDDTEHVVLLLRQLGEGDDTLQVVMVQHAEQDALCLLCINDVHQAPQRVNASPHHE